jgi:hypothetical protein
MSPRFTVQMDFLSGILLSSVYIHCLNLVGEFTLYEKSVSALVQSYVHFLYCKKCTFAFDFFHL